MAIVAVGISHHHAPVDIREQFAFQADDLPRAMHAASALSGIHEAVIINTCNRVEIYAAGEADSPEQQAQLAEQLLTWLHAWHRVTGSYAERFQRYFNGEAVRQLMRVSAGLDSLVLGEPQIGGQVKRAHALAAESSEGQAQVLGPVLDRLFQQAFACAKTVRTETTLGQHPVTVPYAALSLAKQIFSELESGTVLLVGAGEMIELCARHFSAHPVQRIIIANRSLAGAQALADSINQTAGDQASGEQAMALNLEQLPQHLHQADIVITSTASQQVLIDQAMVKQALKARRHQPMLMVDIAVPRDIAADVSRLRDVYLYSIDDLTSVLESNRRQRAAAASEAEAIITREARAFEQWLNLRQASSVLQRFRRQADQHSRQALEQARQQLRKGQSADTVIEQLAHQLSRRLLHLPTTKLRQAIMDGQFEQARQLQDLFLDEAGADGQPQDSGTGEAGDDNPEQQGRQRHAE